MLKELLQEVDQLVSSYLCNLTEVLPEDVGLDRRAAYRLYVGEGVLAVHRSSDSTLQYYGGFEYVKREYRFEVGEWVFYSADDRRVEQCLERWEELVD